MSEIIIHHDIVAYKNGYVGILYGKSSMLIMKEGKEVFYTGFRSINTKEELEQFLAEFKDDPSHPFADDVMMG